MEGVETVGDMARETPHIYATLEDQQETYQVVVVRVKGKITMQSISIGLTQGPLIVM